MSTEIKVPTLGESVTTATVARWIRKVGETVAQDEPIVELETDKVTVEVNAPEAGTIEAIAADEGAEVEVGALLGTIGAGTGAAAAPKKAEPAAEARPAANPQPGVNPPPPPSGPVARTGHAPMPAAQKMMTEQKVDAAQVEGTGKDGRITKGDVLAFIEKPAAAPAPAAPRAQRAADAREERVKMTRLRKTIAARLKEAQNTAAMLTTFNEVDMGPVMALRAEYKDVFEKKHKGIRLGFMSFFVRACIAALREFPAVNAEIDGDEIVYKNFVNMGIAVSSPSGLVVPVLRDADQMSFAQIEKTIADLGKRAGEGKLSMEELTGGTFSISNGGVFGSMLSTPIINPPQSAILGIHATKERAVVENGQIVVRPMNYFALSYDHRIIDGREAVLSLVAMKDALEDPMRLLLEL